jgi:hypothetical protein
MCKSRLEEENEHLAWLGLAWLGLAWLGFVFCIAVLEPEPSVCDSDIKVLQGRGRGLKGRGWYAIKLGRVTIARHGTSARTSRPTTVPWLGILTMGDSRDPGGPWRACPRWAQAPSPTIRSSSSGNRSCGGPRGSILLGGRGRVSRRRRLPGTDWLSCVSRRRFA